MATELIESSGGPRIHIPLNLKRTSGRKRIIAPECESATGNGSIAYRNAMLIALARAFRWRKLLDEGTYSSIADTARSLNVNRWYMARLLRLTLLAPEIVEAVVDGREPEGLSLNRFVGEIPLLWQEQRKEWIVENDQRISNRKQQQLTLSKPEDNMILSGRQAVQD